MPGALAAAEAQTNPEDPTGVAPAPERVSPSFEDSTRRPRAEAPAHVASSIAPSAASRYAVQLNVSQQTYDKLKRAEALLSHVIPGGDIAEILDRALDSLITQLEKRKYHNANPRPRAARWLGIRRGVNARHPGAHPPRVWSDARDAVRQRYRPPRGNAVARVRPRRPGAFGKASIGHPPALPRPQSIRGQRTFGEVHEHPAESAARGARESIRRNGFEVLGTRGDITTSEAHFALALGTILGTGEAAARPICQWSRAT
jgi:hypothetical protein